MTDEERKKWATDYPDTVASLVTAIREVEALRAENAALRAQLATAQRREAEARAVLEALSLLLEGEIAEMSNPNTRRHIAFAKDKASAWLAAGATE